MLHWLSFRIRAAKAGSPPPSDLNLRTVERRPDAPDALVDTGDGLAELLVLLAVGVAQHLGLLADALVLQVLDADGPCGAVDVVCDDDGVLARARADGELDGGIALCEDGERRLDEGVHSLGGSPPVAVVELEALALEDEGADAILGWSVCGIAMADVRGAYLGLCDRPDRCERHCGCRWQGEGASQCWRCCWSKSLAPVDVCLALEGATVPVVDHFTTPRRSHLAAGAPSSTSSKMTYQLPPMLLNLFAPRPPLRWVEPIDHAPEKRCTPKISGVGQYLQAMREYKDNDGYVPTDSWLQKRDRKKIEKKEKQEKLLTEGIKDCTTLHSTATSILTTRRQAQRRPQGAGRRLQDAVRLAPRVRRDVGRPRARVWPLRSH